MPRCIFCVSESNSFNRIEHLVPESLGGDILLSDGLVCDKCNEYFGRNIEQKALDTPTLSFMRTYLGIPNKKKKQRVHEGFQFKLVGQFPEPSAFYFPEKKVDYISRTGTGQLLIPSQIGISSICRLLLKMGIEYVAMSPEYDVFDPQFLSARSAARSPKLGAIWPIAYIHLKVNDLTLFAGKDEYGEFVRESVYTINLALEPALGLIGIHFIYGWFKYIVPLNTSDSGIFKTVIIRHNLTHLNEEPFDILTPNISSLD